MPIELPLGVTVFERGWLSSNNVLLAGPDQCALVDSGYCSHADQTLALAQAALAGRALDLLANTHLHSDHCGGNAALQGAYPALQTHIPPGHAPYVAQWDPHTLSYAPTGQECPPFRLDGTLPVGGEVALGAQRWQVHAAPGHDPHSVILFEPASRTLVSADALWQRGFGVVFPELDGDAGFDDVSATLDRIEALQPRVVVPGHGSVFTDVADALAFARQRLNAFVRNPQRHSLHAAKVLLKFKLLDWQRVSLAQLQQWAQATPFFQRVLGEQFAGVAAGEALQQLVAELVHAQAAVLHDGWLHNA
ncbi:MAG: MBL fold metallo-hydrolase [Rhodoferax sp.]